MKIAPDKWRHFYVGIAMGAVLQMGAGWLLPGALLATIAAFVASFVISYGFELYSLYTGHGHYEFMDAVASMIGAVCGMAPIFLYQNGYI
ncbi:hypothetical protein MKQ70_34710 [Chitinophaga sedimenti]|uniref:hypothetical protein n=1 Tax=Chitinophaga sedimenti TaxID=2033606 RepID=UPI0020058387|nr:hypothetical protein [Chitinophaga sedimenti]MCK7559817.1 hypothetical protein [Chitinophaga sedimenti]